MKRIPSLDLARGLTVLFMPAVHTFIIYSKPSVHPSLLVAFLAFIAEGPGAQLFMIIMGISFSFSYRTTHALVCKRALLLLLAAYALNFLKFIIPIGLGWMPDTLLAEFQLPDSRAACIFFLCLGDILHFASIAYLVVFFTFRLRHFQYWSLLFAGITIFLSPFLWDLHSSSGIPDYFLEWIGGHPPQVFFPLFPWITYPLAGLSVGYFLKHFDREKVFVATGMAGMGLCFLSLFFPETRMVYPWPYFYRTLPVDTIFHLGFVLFWLWLFYWIEKKIPPNPFFRLLNFCSRNITTIYLVQWPLVFWCIGFTGYQTLNLQDSLIWMVLLTAITLLLTFTITLFYAKRKSL